MGRKARGINLEIGINIYTLCCAKSLQWSLTCCNHMDYIARQALLSTRFFRQEY